MKHDHGHHHHGRGHRGGGPGRFFDSGDLRYLVLHLIRDEPRHGYEIIKLIEAEMGGTHAPSPGIVYPTLTLLEEIGLATVAPQGSRKQYTITDLGRRELEANRATVEAVRERMRQAGKRQTRDRAGPVTRAMENLKLVLRMRGDDWSAEQLATVTDMIDETARRIERL